MIAARLGLVVLPIGLVLAMAQSALWVPSYDSVGADNPARLLSFVETSIGDAGLLNPILASDAATGRITDLIFDGLLRIDDRLQLRGVLATRWRVGERAWLALRDSADADLVARHVQQRIEQMDPELLVAPVVVHPAHDSTHMLDDETASPARSINIRVPRRLELVLSRVEPELDSWLADAPTAPMTVAERRERIDGAQAALSPAQIDAILPALEHNPEIEFWLRKDVRFHDGQPFDADDVVFTFAALMNPANRSPRRSSFEPVKSVVAVSKHQVRVVYKRLFSPAVNIWTMGIVPAHLLDDAALRKEKHARSLSDAAGENFGIRDSRFNRNPVGTGAFVFKSWSSDELIHLTRNADYHRGDDDQAPVFNDFFYRIIPDTLTQEMEFRSGAADTYQAEPHQAARYRSDKRYRAFSAVQPGYTYIGYNQRKPPFDDVRVRTALGMAIDVRSMIRYALFDEAERVTGPFASITQWYDRAVPALAFDPSAARELLREAGWSPDADGWLRKNGKRLEFNLITNNGNLRRKAIATIVQQQWRRIGVKCNVQLFEWAVFLKDFINTGQFDAVVLGWQLGLDPDLYQIWHSTQSDPNELNFVGFSDATSDRLMEQLRREYDQAKQVRIAHELHRRIATLQPYTFLFAPRSTRLLDKRIVMRDGKGGYEAVRAGGAGDLFYHMNRWQHLAHDPGF